MRHYLNKKLKGKLDELGLAMYPVYVRFAVNRQSFQVKSRLILRKINDSQLSNAINVNNPLFVKDIQIVKYCAEKSTINGYLDFDQFKFLYSIHSVSIVNWLRDQITSERNSDFDQFFSGNSTGPEKGFLSDIENNIKIDRKLVQYCVNGFALTKSGTIHKFIYVNDWFGENLRDEFVNYLDKVNINASERKKVMKFLQKII